MPERHKIYLALPDRPAIHSALENALRLASSLELSDFAITDEIGDADIVVTDSQTHSNTIVMLPDTVRYLQLIDCGSGAPIVSDDKLTVANASSLSVNDPADWAIDQWEIIQRRKIDRVAGIIGFGTLGYELGKRLNASSATIWVNDIRTPRQRSFQSVGARRSSLDMLLSRSDVVFVAVHHGPTSDPLLSCRELRLLNVGATVINMSGEQVVDREAIESLNSTENRQIDYRSMPADLASASASRHPRATTHYILDNLGEWAEGRQPRSIVETVTHSAAGDPRILGIEDVAAADANLNAVPFAERGERQSAATAEGAHKLPSPPLPRTVSFRRRPESRLVG